MAVTRSDNLNVGRSGRLSGIEASRGLAASIVVFYHAGRHLEKAGTGTWLREAFQFGHAGVDFFFVISGFIILFVHFNDAGRPARLAHYAGRRFTRLIPVYWVALALTILLDTMGQTGLPSSAAIAWSASLLPSNEEMILGVAWTLRYEVLFYALFAVLIVNRTAGLIALGAWLTATVLTAASPAAIEWPPQQFHGIYNLEFFMGMAVALLLHRGPIPRPRLVLSCGVLLFAIAALAEDTHQLDGYGKAARLAYGLPSALIVAGIAEADRRGLLTVPPFARMIGSASYSIYLFHFACIGLLWQVLKRAGLTASVPPEALFVLLSGTAITGGVLMSVWVEYPLMSRVRGLMEPAQVPRPSPG